MARKCWLLMGILATACATSSSGNCPSGNCDGGTPKADAHVTDKDSAPPAGDVIYVSTSGTDG